MCIRFWPTIRKPWRQGAPCLIRMHGSQSLLQEPHASHTIIRPQFRPWASSGVVETQAWICTPTETRMKCACDSTPVRCNADDCLWEKTSIDFSIHKRSRRPAVVGGNDLNTCAVKHGRLCTDLSSYLRLASTLDETSTRVQRKPSLTFAGSVPTTT